MKKNLIICFAILCFAAPICAQIPVTVSVQIVKAEDERRYDKTLEDLIKNPVEQIRARAALAAGRIGDERGVPMLTNMIENDTEAVRPTAAFALGEIESIKAADAILKNLKVSNVSAAVRARLTEAAGKIAAANAKDAKAVELGEAILDVLEAELKKPKVDRLTVLLGITAILRAKPEDGSFVAAKFLTNIDARIRADAANTLSRLRAKNANEQLRAMLLADDDAIARANAARALGAAEDKDAFDLLLEAAATDEDSRVRVSAIRSLGSLKDKRAADKLLERGATLLVDYKKSKSVVPNEKSELLEIATTLGRILPNSNNSKAVEFLTDFGLKENYISPEIHIAFARISPSKFLEVKPPNNICSVLSINSFTLCWQFESSFAQGLSELANLKERNFSLSETEKNLIVRLKFDRQSWGGSHFDVRSVPDRLKAFVKLKPENSTELLRGFLDYQDAIVRATAAELLGEMKPSEENILALNRAFDYSLLSDKQYNDAQLAILDALQKQGAARGALLLALKESDYLVRQKAMQIIKANNLDKDDAALKVQLEEMEKNRNMVKPFSSSSRSKFGLILNTDADYLRAVSRKNAQAILTTEKGSFTIDFAPEDAPLTVDNFIKLAKANYFNNLEIHRVVPNFVMQDGDPRGDGNGGPGWEIRDEINMLEYERGAVGMALSGKDTGGSQWFVTHSPQPHLDGGYTVFGRVNESDMKIVDKLVRGDKITSVKIVEANAPPKKRK